MVATATTPAGPVGGPREREASGCVTLLAADRVAPPPGWVPADRPGRGAVCVRPRRDLVRRAEPGPCGPLVLEAQRQGSETAVTVWGDDRTPAEAVDAALRAARAWIGCDDDPAPFLGLVRGHAVLGPLLRRLGPPLLSRTPRVGEALARAVIAQLVQAIEAARSTAQVAALVGSPAAGGVWAWPTRAQIGAAPTWRLRRCGVSSRAALALHAGAVHDRALAAARGDPGLLDRRLRALPGVGVWTSGEVRLALGDADAVPVGDYNLPTLVGHVLGGGRRHDWDDQAMLELLAPFAGQRGRVLRLVVAGMAARLVTHPPRRAPHAAISRHRYW